MLCAAPAVMSTGAVTVEQSQPKVVSMKSPSAAERSSPTTEQVDVAGTDTIVAPAALIVTVPPATDMPSMRSSRSSRGAGLCVTSDRANALERSCSGLLTPERGSFQMRSTSSDRDFVV